MAADDGLAELDDIQDVRADADPRKMDLSDIDSSMATQIASQRYPGEYHR